MSRIVVFAGLLVLATGCRGAPPTVHSTGAPLPHVDAPEVLEEVARRRTDVTSQTPVRAVHASAESDASTPKSQIEIASFESGDSGIEAAQPAAGPIWLTLDDAIQTTLEWNPDLVALRSGQPAAHAAYHVALARPFNPQLQAQVLPYVREPGGMLDPVAQQYAIVQTFELAHQRRYRAGAALANQHHVESMIRQAEVLNVAQAERLFLAALYQRDLRKMNQSLAALNEQMVEVIERRMRAGQASAADVALARLQAQSSQRQQRLAEANYQTALTNLGNHLGLDSNAHMELVGEWLNWQWRSLDEVLGGSLNESASPPAGERISDDSGEHSLRASQWDDATLGQLISDRPDVVAARAAVAMAQKNLDLADAMRRPNLQIGPLYQRDNTATEYWGLQAQMDIPVVSTGQPLVRQRMAELQQQQIIASQTETKAMLEVRGAFRRYARALRLVEQSRDQFGLDLADALKPFEDQFEAGQIDLLQVFSGRTAFIQSRQGFLDLLNELALAAAEVTQATGLPPQELILQTPPGSSQPEESHWP